MPTPSFQKITPLHHLLQQSSSSHDSLTFMSSMLCTFLQQIKDTTHTRRAELQTMCHLQGRSLREIVLSMYDGLAKNVSVYVKQVNEYFQIYQQVGELVGKRVQELEEFLRNGEYQKKECWESAKYLNEKQERINKQIQRINKINEQAIKSVYMEQMKKKYGVIEEGFEKMQSTSASSKDKINESKILDLKAESINLKEAIKRDRQRSERIYAQIQQKGLKIQQSFCNFDQLMTIVNHFNINDNKQNMDQSNFYLKQAKLNQMNANFWKSDVAANKRYT